jgi:hypothetical protein
MFAARPGNDLSCKTEQPERLSSFGHIRGLRALLPLHNLELDYIALLQTLVAFRSDGAIVDENVGAVFAANEAITFGIIEPFHRSLHTFHEPPGTFSGCRPCHKLILILRLRGKTVKEEW